MEVHLPSKLVCYHYNRGVLGLPGRGEPAYEIDCDDFPKMPGNNCVVIDIIRQFISCLLIYIACPYKLLYLFPHFRPSNTFTQPLRCFLDAEIPSQQSLIGFANKLRTHLGIIRNSHILSLQLFKGL